MLQVFMRNDAGLAVPVGTPIVFTEKLLGTRDARSVSVPTSQINLTDQGNYKIEFNANIDAQAAGNVGVQMLVNGAEYAGGRTGLVSSTPTAPRVVSFTSLVHVGRGCSCVNATKSLQFVIEGVDADVFLANLVITRYGG